LAFSLKIAASFWDDPKYLSLEADLGPIKSLGSCVLAWKLAKAFWMKSKTPIPENVWKRHKLPEALFLYGLAKRRDDGIYVSGTESFVEEYEQKVSAGTASCESRKSKKANKNQENSQRTVEAENDFPFQPSPFPSPFPFQNTKEREKVGTLVVELIDVWRETLSHFGINAIPAQSDMTMARIIAKYKQPNDIRLALIGQRFERDNPPFMVKEHLSLSRFLNNEKHFEKMVLLGSSRQEVKFVSSTEGLDFAIQSNQ